MMLARQVVLCVLKVPVMMFFLTPSRLALPCLHMVFLMMSFVMPTRLALHDAHPKGRAH